MDINRVTLKGRLGSAPQCRTTAGDQSICSFTLATNEAWTDKSGARQERTTWHKIFCWGALATWVQANLGKGSEVFLEGKLCERKWQSKDGQPRTAIEIQADQIDLIRRAAA